MENVSRAETGNAPYSKGIPYNVTLHAWPVPKPNDTTTFLLTSNESVKNYTISFHNINATGYIADDDLIDTGLTDVQTFILASLATIIPLLITVATLLGARFIWKKYKSRAEEGYKGILQREESSDPFSKSKEYSLAPELKTSESQFTMSPIEKQTTSSSPQLLTPKSNGSVITVTLKNNHLIVETEETDVSTPLSVKIESKGTSTKFVTSTTPDFKIHETTEADVSELSPFSPSCGPSPLSTAQVHTPPVEKDEENQRHARICTTTGFSQSDLSESSEETQNPSYRYGNQIGYSLGGYGYPEYMGYSEPQHCYEKISTELINENDHSKKALIKVSFESESNFAVNDVLASDIHIRERIMEENTNKRLEEEIVMQNIEILSVENEARNHQHKNVENILNLESVTISNKTDIKANSHEQLRMEKQS